jgi:hypothetical protein
MAKCGAKKRNGEKCKSPAMPNGKCRLHGGATPARNETNIKHGFYSKCYTEPEKANLDLLKLGSLEAEIALAKTQLNRAASVPEFDEHKQRNEHYRPDVIERLLNVVGRLEKQHAEITADKNTDELDWTSIARIGAALAEEVDSIKTTPRTNTTDD